MYSEFFGAYSVGVYIYLIIFFKATYFEKFTVAALT